jgi:23S rRNA pseudouridine2605 synthase
MNDPTPSPDEPATLLADESAAVAPKRRRSRAATVPDAPLSADPAAPTVDAVAPSPAPKRRARKAAPADAEPQAASALPESAAVEREAGVDVEVPVPRARRARAATKSRQETTEEASVEAPVAAPVESSGQSSFDELPATVPQRVAPSVLQASASPGQVGSSGEVFAPEPSDEERGPRGDGDRKRRRRGARGDREAVADGSQQVVVADAVARADAPAARPNDATRAAQMPAPPVADVAERFEAVISGQFDQDVQASAEGQVDIAEAAQVDADEAAESDPAKRVLRPEPEAPKLHKVLAAAGIGSRRDMETLIEEGQVTVNGEVAHQGMRITWGDQIKVAGKPVKVRIAPSPARVLAYHKPVGEVVTHHDPEGRPTVFKRLPRLPQGKWLSVGRLDLNTEGLLLFTNSGELANQLMHPRFGVEREYAVRVLGELTPAQRQQLLDGVEVEGQKAAFQAIEDGGGSDGANHWWRVVITEGRNREVRKLFDTVGLTVSRLIRIRYGTVVLPRGLKRGVFVELGDNDVRLIRRLAGGDARRPGPGPGPQAAGAPQGQGAGQGQGPGPGQGGFNNNPKGGKHQKQRGRNGPPQGQPGYAGGPGGPGGQPPRGPKQGGPGPYSGPPRGPRNAPYGNGNGAGPAPDPLPYDEHREADDPPFIPNPLEQTFDRRFATGSKRIVAGFGRPGDDSRSGGPGGPRKKGEPREPDPMQTSVGYIGADAYFTKPGGGGNFNNKRGRKR